MTRQTDTLAGRVKLARTRRGLNQQELADRAGLKQPDVSKIERGLILKTTAIARLSAVLAVPSYWLEMGEGPEPDWDGIPSFEGGQPHGVSFLGNMIEPPTYEMESIMSAELPAMFKVALTDDAMAPEYPKGVIVLLSTQEGAPRAGDAVLVSDDAGNAFFRSYEVRRPGHWQAVALNRSYQPLDSAADGLTVLAICVGRFGRRG